MSEAAVDGQAGAGAGNVEDVLPASVETIATSQLDVNGEKSEEGNRFTQAITAWRSMFRESHSSTKTDFGKTWISRT